jgi:hypothetical protein
MLQRKGASMGTVTGVTLIPVTFIAWNALFLNFDREMLRIRKVRSYLPRSTGPALLSRKNSIDKNELRVKNSLGNLKVAFRS